MSQQMMMIGSTTPHTASVSNNTASGTGGGIISTSPSSVSITGGSGSFTYSWTKVSGSTAVNISGSSTSATCTFIIAGQPVGTYSATYKVTVTDTVSGLAIDSNDFTVQITRTS